jgi:hypothetical protein
MALSLLALVVPPELHISDKGLIGVGEKGCGLVGLFRREQGGERLSLLTRIADRVCASTSLSKKEARDD